MTFDNKAQKKTYKEVGRILEKAHGNILTPLDDAPSYALWFDNTGVKVSVMKYGDDSVILVRGHAVQEVEPAPDLHAYLLEQNNAHYFGLFAMNGGDIYCDHSLFGPTLDEEELLDAVARVAQVTAEKSGEIVKRWGGIRLHEN